MCLSLFLMSVSLLLLTKDEPFVVKDSAVLITAISFLFNNGVSFINDRLSYIWDG